MVKAVDAGAADEVRVVLVRGGASVTPADVPVAAGKLSTGRSSPGYALATSVTTMVTPADISPTAVVLMLLPSGSSCRRPPGGL